MKKCNKLVSLLFLFLFCLPVFALRHEDLKGFQRKWITVMTKDGKKRTIHVIVPPKGWKPVSDKCKKKKQPTLKTVQDPINCVECEFSENQEIAFEIFLSTGGGDPAAQYAALDYMNNGDIIDRTDSATWTSADPSVAEIIGPGQ
ncbi:MAG TPA: hypothetical protein VKR57_02445 [Terriglobales bacterium]|jgi:hypothetical protein|nr:hypothetical protein [Terriglobales bacterium]